MCKASADAVYYMIIIIIIIFKLLCLSSVTDYSARGPTGTYLNFEWLPHAHWTDSARTLCGWRLNSKGGRDSNINTSVKSHSSHMTQMTCEVTQSLFPPIVPIMPRSAHCAKISKSRTHRLQDKYTRRGRLQYVLDTQIIT